MGTDCILPPVPVRTSTVVALGLILLAVVGIGAIFGNTLLAVVAPAGPPSPTTAAPAASAKPGQSANTAGGQVPGRAAPGTGKDGSS